MAMPPPTRTIQTRKITTMSLKRFMALVVTTLLGGAVGLIVGYLTSGYVGMSAGFYYWIMYPIDSWHWPILGALVAGLASLALHLWLPEKGTTPK